MTYGSGPMLRILQSAIKLFNKRIEDAIFDFWLKRGLSDLVVSVIPNFNKQLYNGIKRAYKIPYVTVMCDLADCPPHFWMDLKINTWYVVVIKLGIRQRYGL